MKHFSGSSTKQPPVFLEHSANNCYCRRLRKNRLVKGFVYGAAKTVCSFKIRTVHSPFLRVDTINIFLTTALSGIACL